MRINESLVSFNHDEILPPNEIKYGGFSISALEHRIRILENQLKISESNLNIVKENARRLLDTVTAKEMEAICGLPYDECDKLLDILLS